MNRLFCNPVEIISSRGCVREYDGYSRFGRKCLIVCGKSSARLCGVLDDLQNVLTAQGVAFSVFDRTEQNPTVETCLEAGTYARETKAEFIIGVGGGSPLDASKAAAVFAANPHMDVKTLYDENAMLSDPLPIIAIPTTAGTGSEVTQYSVLTVHSIQNKKTLKTPKIFPKVALLDPEYTLTLSKSITAATAVDALSHSVEGYFAKGATVISDALAEKAMLFVGRGLSSLAEGKLDVALREKLLLGSMLAGLVISVTGTSFVHSFGYPLTYFEGIPHGEANAYFLPDFLRYMESTSQNRVSRVLRLCGVKSTEEFENLILNAVPCDRRFSRDNVMKYARIGLNGASAKKALFEPELSDAYDMFKKYIR